MSNKIKYLGETSLAYLIKKCKETFALLTHKHSWDELEEKPFEMETIGERTLFCECVGNNSDSGDVEVILSNNYSTHLKNLLGKNLIVTINGVEYETVGVDFGRGSWGCICGDYKLSQQATNDNAYLEPAEAIVYTVKIEIFEGSSVIPEEVIPDTIARVSYVDEQIDAMELITVDDIDEICGITIENASSSETTF